MSDEQKPKRARATKEEPQGNPNTQLVARKLHGFSDEEVAVIRDVCAKGASDAEFRVFLHQAWRTGLDPLAKQIYLVKRWSTEDQKEIMAVQVGIDGFRLVAERSGKYGGQLGPQWCDAEGNWTDAWYKVGAPTAARVGIIRKDWTQPVWGVARYDSYVARKQNGQPTRMWMSMPDNQLAKCAESQGLRKAFPLDLSGLYTDAEMEQASNPHDDDQPFSVRMPDGSPAPTPTPKAEEKKAEPPITVDAEAKPVNKAEPAAETPKPPPPPPEPERRDVAGQIDWPEKLKKAIARYNAAVTAAKRLNKASINSMLQVNTLRGVDMRPTTDDKFAATCTTIDEITDRILKNVAEAESA